MFYRAKAGWPSFIIALTKAIFTTITKMRVIIIPSTNMMIFSLINSCTIDWFTDWPEDALEKVCYVDHCDDVYDDTSVTLTNGGIYTHHHHHH